MHPGPKLVLAVGLLCACTKAAEPALEEPPVDCTPERGDFSCFEDLGWLDIHTHLWSHLRIDDYVGFQNRFGIHRMGLQSVTRSQGLLDGTRPNYNAEGLLAKARYPDRFYLFVGLDLSRLHDGEAALRDDLEAQIHELFQAGADGVKLLMKYTHVEPLREIMGFDYLPDNPTLEPALRAAGAYGLPVLIHLDEQYFSHGLTALTRYPELTWIITHMAFAGTSIERLDSLLDAGPTVYLDAGHYVHLGELLLVRQAAMDFLTRRASRVFQSSDFAAGCALWDLEQDACPSELMALEQTWTLRAMLESDATVAFRSVYTDQNVVVQGLDLPRAVLDPLYRVNAEQLLGVPRAIDCVPALQHVDRLLGHTTDDDDRLRLEAIRLELDSTCAR